jgi:APA family basic amino acid/polyamine antiporter
MTNLAVETWIFFAIWLVIGIAIYFAYGQRHSRLNERFTEAKEAVNGRADATAGQDSAEKSAEDEDEFSRA